MVSRNGEETGALLPGQVGAGEMRICSMHECVARSVWPILAHVVGRQCPQIAIDQRNQPVR